ncbi:hypothetical protein HYW43_03515 [Candidatus Daviesbacteria bacterium]|nr:hypothetical protein [Candidatus Daviesbacteria bacterium]
MSKEYRPTDIDRVAAEMEKLLAIEDASEQLAQTGFFIDQRTRQLSEQAVAVDIQVITGAERGFIHPASWIYTSPLYPAFTVDDPEVYRTLFREFAEFSAVPELRWHTIDELAKFAILRTLQSYFGNGCTTQETENKRDFYYMLHTRTAGNQFSIRNFKGAGIAACSEKAAVSQNLLAFLGYDTYLIPSTHCVFGVGSDPVSHLYNVFGDGFANFIFDPSNPGLVYNEQGKIIDFFPAIYPISDRQFYRLMIGAGVVVEHQDKVLRDDDRMEIKGTQKRGYAGPTVPMFMPDDPLRLHL